MSLHTPVPSDVEPTSLLDLVHDCREVAGVLGASVIDLTRPAAGAAAGAATGAVTGAAAGLAAAVGALPRIPLTRIPLDRLPFSFGVMPAEITEDVLVGTAAGLDGYGDYGT